MKKVIKGIMLLLRKSQAQIFNVHIIFDCEKVAIGGGISAQPLPPELINKNLDEIYEHLGFDVYHPKLLLIKFRNDANLMVLFYQHIQTLNNSFPKEK